ncbi:MAG TPA: universal stress protein [Candidatus Polarisedimenticolaceae bacterium]
MLPFRTILVATDFSSESVQAFATARAIAVGTASRVVLMHVLPDEPPTPWEIPPYVDFGLSVVPAAEYLGKLRAEVSRRLETLAAEHFAGTAGCEVRVGVGDPARELVRASEGIGADLIVLATHGWAGWRKLVFGSVAERVLREAACPVLVVKCAARGVESPTPPPPA